MKRYLYIILLVGISMQAQQNANRIINFAGMDWYVRSGQGNPGHNTWSSGATSVWVDTYNRLHLKIKKINGKWYAAEVLSVHPAHYGKYRFYVANRVDLLNKNLVASVFLYKDDLNEMDIEFSRWRYDNIPNTQYVVQPEKRDNVHKFEMNLTGDYTTHIIDWQPDKIHFESFHGHYLQAPKKEFSINDWTYSKKQLIDDGQYRIHINLWMVDGFPPTDKQEAEIIIAGMDSPISPIEISGKSHQEIQFYPNHYYDNIFVHCDTDQAIRYTLKNKSGNTILQDNCNPAYFSINMLPFPIGTYELLIEMQNTQFHYTIYKHY